MLAAFLITLIDVVVICVGTLALFGAARWALRAVLRIGKGRYMGTSATICDDCSFGCPAQCVFVRTDEQPYFQAYRISRREPGSLRAGFEYMIWIGGMWRDWRRLRGLGDYAPVSEEQRQDFGRWLFASVGHPEAA